MITPENRLCGERTCDSDGEGGFSWGRWRLESTICGIVRSLLPRFAVTHRLPRDQNSKQSPCDANSHLVVTDKIMARRYLWFVENGG